MTKIKLCLANGVLISMLTIFSTSALSAQSTKIRVATFNVSMEALNYIPYVKGKTPNVEGDELSKALNSGHQQIKNIAEIIQTVNPDIILLNEFDRDNEQHLALQVFINDYLAKGQKNQQGIDYPYFYQAPVNTGVASPFDLTNNGDVGVLPGDGYGFGYFPGHFAMALLSKYPIDNANIRTFQYFLWQDMPNALIPTDPNTKQTWYSPEAWAGLRLSSKSHWDIPVDVNGQLVHVIASHPTPPVFDGPEDRNGSRNHDEIRFVNDYVSALDSDYIYDDKGHKGGLKAQQRFIILGDLNASATDGDAVKAGIDNLLKNPLIQDPMPTSKGAKAHTPENKHAPSHTAYWRMRADYVLPSALGFTITDSGVFWPSITDEKFRLIKDRSASSDHRLVWVDLMIK
ncbi:endonuclease/exonuclease/phosphatase family protein [Colwelliaceae bacterium BS250]